jgi:hypothetical protein
MIAYVVSYTDFPAHVGGDMKGTALTTTASLATYEGKKVIITVNLKAPNDAGETAIEVEGTAQAANELGILLKPKGRTNLDLIEAADIEDIKLAPEPDKKLAAKTLKDVELGNAKQHLLDRHGLTLADVNALTEESAFSYHSTLDHKALDLGHVHGAKAAEERAAEATAKAEKLVVEPEAEAPASE